MTVPLKPLFAWILAVLWITAASARAEPITWNWSFAGESGQFVTDGLSHSAGSYTLIDFSVTSSSVGGTLGSLSHGQYSASGFATDMPYSFVWDGSRVTFWDSAGVNTFNWWPFDDLTSDRFYLFGWSTGNINDVRSAALWDGNNKSPLAVGLVDVSPASPIPEPATVLLLTSGLGMLARFRARRGACSAPCAHSR